MNNKKITIINIIRDPLPPARSDVLNLFGKFLFSLNIETILIGQYARTKNSFFWGAGKVYALGNMNGMLSSALTPLWDIISITKAAKENKFSCIQVRDKISTGFLSIYISTILRVPFIYWMSFPIVEGHELRANDVGFKKGFFVWLANKTRAVVTKSIFYNRILSGADHIFVQSEAMRNWLAVKGFDPRRMTAVPMGVDTTEFQREKIEPATDPRLDGKRVIIYIGSLGKARNSAFLLDLLLELRKREPDILLVLAGDAVSKDERQWIREEIAVRELDENILLTGWLEQKEALRFAVRAEVGLSPIPRGELYDVSSPTKLVEYLALGLPSVANDIPDQKLVVEQSGAGLCVPMEIDAFRDAVLKLLCDKALCAQFANAGPGYVQRERSYDVLAQRVAETYRNILGVQT